MRTLGIDLGTVRVGLALSDELGITAMPVPALSGVPGGEDLVEAIMAIAKERGAGRVVIGLPIKLDGTEGPEAEGARAFARVLSERSDLEVDLWDERLSTRQAEKLMIDAGVRRKKRRKSIDSVAAALVLQSYLDARAR
ncbi:Holliday junction resolvase RuvX [Acidobacteriota bacterium]